MQIMPLLPPFTELQAQADCMHIVRPAAFGPRWLRLCWASCLLLQRTIVLVLHVGSWCYLTAFCEVHPPDISLASMECYCLRW